MSKQTLILPGEMPGLNQVILRAKRHWSKYAIEKKRLTRLVSLASSQLQPVTAPVRLNIRWVCRDKRRDPDNICAGGRKIILDGLVLAGVLRGDGWSQVKSFTDTFDVDRNHPRIEIELIEIETGGEGDGILQAG